MSNTIQGNLIGTSISGTEAYGNSGDGVDIFFRSTNNQVMNNLISGNHSAGVRISGNCRVGEGALLGTGATLVQQVSVGGWSTVGAGAVVIEDIPDKVVAVGVPAKVVRSKE